MIDRLLDDPTARFLEETLNFTEQRHALLVEDIANADTPGYVARDVSPQDFDTAMQKAVAQRQAALNGAFDLESTGGVQFAKDTGQLSLKPRPIAGGTAFYDKGVRSMEYLMGQLADNAQAHNMAATFLKGRYDLLARAISMRV